MSSEDEDIQLTGSAEKPPRHPQQPSSLPPSPMPSIPDQVHLTNVSSTEQLAVLPPEFRSGDPVKPLRHVDDHGDEYHYSLRPMFYAAIFILLVELLERFCFYGINYTQTAYLTGAYNDDWNAGMASVAASSYVSISTAVAYTAPFSGAFLADSALGDYRAILFGATCLYVPGLVLIFFTTIPGALGDGFNRSALRLGLLFLWPVGTGIVKSIVNVFGAKQFHPVLQSSLIESYYVNFYMCINIGALMGGILVPIVAQRSVTAAYFIPVAVLIIGVLVFACGTPRYVRVRPRHDLDLLACLRFFGPRESAARKIKRRLQETTAGGSGIGIDVIARVSALVVPFNIAYSQMATTFIVQGTVMSHAFGVIDASIMNNADAISVLVFGYLIGNQFYPWLARRGVKIPTTFKFAIGSALGAIAIGCALLVEYRIHSVYAETGERVNILWQTFSYVLIGAGEIFAVSSAYEVAFKAAPAKKKALASATNLFFMGGLPNLLCLVLYNACRAWFRNSHGSAKIHHLEDYTEAKVANYFWLLLGIASMGVFVNILPPVRRWVAGIEEEAAESIKSPMSTPVIRKRLFQKPPRRGSDVSDVDEESPLVRAKRHQDYLKYGSGPVLYKQGSMRAGPALSHSERKLSVQKYAIKRGKLIVPIGTRTADTNSPAMREREVEQHGSSGGNGYQATNEETPKMHRVQSGPNL